MYNTTNVRFRKLRLEGKRKASLIIGKIVCIFTRLVLRTILSVVKIMKSVLYQLDFSVDCLFQLNIIHRCDNITTAKICISLCTMALIRHKDEEKLKQIG